MPLSELEKRFAKRAKELKLKPPHLPFKAVCMDGIVYKDRENNYIRFPRVEEEAEERLQHMGQCYNLPYEEELAFVGPDGKYYITRNIEANSDALKAANFKCVFNVDYFNNKIIPIKTNALFDDLYKIPEDEQERLQWAVRDSNLEQFNYALAHGATISDGFDNPIVFTAICNPCSPERDAIIRKLLPHSKLVNGYGETVLHRAFKYGASVHTVLPDLLKAGLDPLKLNKYGVPAFLEISPQEEASKSLKPVMNAMLAAEGIINAERRLLQAHHRILNAAFTVYPDNDEKLRRIISGLRETWSFAYGLGPKNKGKIPPPLTTLLAPLEAAIGTTTPLEHPKVQKILNAVTTPGITFLGYTAKDFIDEFTAHVVLPQALLEYSKETGQVLDDEFLRKLNGQELVDRVSPSVGAHLLLSRDIDTVIGLVKAWHDDDVAFPDTLRPLKASGEWHSLTGQKEHVVSTLNDVAVRVLTTAQELMDEGKVMKHCVGKGNYTVKCLDGKAHLFSVRKAGREQPLSTIEATWEKGELTMHQNHSERNGDPSSEAVEAARWLKEQLESGKIKAATEFGETEESKKQNPYPKILRTIGFDITQDNINAAFREYTSNSKRRAREYNAKTGKYNIISRRTDFITGNINTKVMGEDGKIKTVGQSLREMPADQWFQASGMWDTMKEGFYSKMPNTNAHDVPELGADIAQAIENWQRHAQAMPVIPKRGLLERIKDALRGQDAFERGGR